jgi:hypothetical protein
MDIKRCRFAGFEYVICYGEGTKGAMEDCLVMDCGHQGVILYAGADVKVVRNVITGSKFHAVRSTGGTLDMRDNLIIDNANRGVYLGNRSAAGVISDNAIIRNGTGISGFAQSKVRIENNVISDSRFGGVDMRDSCSLTVRDNILCGNGKGVAVFKEEGGGENRLIRNVFWNNEVDTEEIDRPGGSIEADPGFLDAENGDFSLKDGPAKEKKQGLADTGVIKKLWERWENRADEGVPFE